MAIDGAWSKLCLSNIDTVPVAPGVYEIATLVRSTILIGRSGGRDLRSCLNGVLTDPSSPIRQRALYYRYEQTPRDDERYRELIDEYAHDHAGHLPPMNHLADADRAKPARAKPSKTKPAAPVRLVNQHALRAVS